MNKGTAVNLVMMAIGAAALITLFNQGMKMAGRFNKPKSPARSGKLDLGTGNAPALKDIQSQLMKGLGKISSDSEDDVATQPISAAPSAIPAAPPAPIVIVRYVYVNQPSGGTISVAQQTGTLPGTAVNSGGWPRISMPPVQKLPVGYIPEPTRIR